MALLRSLYGPINPYSRMAHVDSHLLSLLVWSLFYFGVFPFFRISFSDPFGVSLSFWDSFGFLVSLLTMVSCVAHFPPALILFCISARLLQAAARYTERCLQKKM